MLVRSDGLICAFDNVVHLSLLWDHVWAQGAGLVSYVIQSKVVENKGVPIVGQQFSRHVSRYIVINFCKVLQSAFSTTSLHTRLLGGPTETKKLVVPSVRENVPGNSLCHVSSPCITILPPFALIWPNHVSCCASEDVSDSAKFMITSKNDGIPPVVRAFTRGMVTVGDVAWAVNGSAAPSRIRLSRVSVGFRNCRRFQCYLCVKSKPEDSL